MTQTSQRTEHGYVTPDGVTHWQGYNPTDPLAKQHDLTTVRGQEQTTAAFRQQLAHAAGAAQQAAVGCDVCLSGRTGRGRRDAGRDGAARTSRGNRHSRRKAIAFRDL